MKHLVEDALVFYQSYALLKFQAIAKWLTISVHTNNIYNILDWNAHCTTKATHIIKEDFDFHHC